MNPVRVNSAREPRPPEPDPHRQQEHLRDPVDERPVAGEQFVGDGDAEECRLYISISSSLTFLANVNGLFGEPGKPQFSRGFV